MDSNADRRERRAADASALGCHTLLDMAKFSLRQANLSLSGTADQIIQRAFAHSTSDYPKILESAANKVLLRHWQSAPATHESLCNFTVAPDFKNLPRYKLGDAGDLVLTPELAPMAESSVPEAKGAYALAT